MATDMPEDIQTPNEPNGVNQSKVSSVVGKASPIDYTKEDPWGTLPPGAIKYEVNSSKWTAVPINQGVYKIVSRNEGQAIYVAEDVQGTQSLRITKSFNIETSGRTVLYLKGQSDLDILIEQVVNLLATKADKKSVYTKKETDQKIQNAINGAIGGLTSILTYKGTVANEAALAGILNPSQGDTYQAEDTGFFYTWIAESAPGSWEKLSGSIVDLNNYYTKGQIDLALTGKADQTDLEALEQKVDLLLLQNKPFTYIQKTDPATVNPDPTKEGEIWFNNSTGLIYIRKTSQIDQTLYWLNSIDNALLALDTKYMKLEGDQTASGVKTFTGNIKLATPPASDEDVTNKQYVDDAIANAGMGSANFVTLDDTTQSIDGHKTFIGVISVPNPQNETDAASKKYVDDKFQDATTTLPLNVVLTDSDQTISSIKTFENGKNPKYDAHPTSFTDLELVDRKYVDDAVAGGITLPLNLAHLDQVNNFTTINSFTGVTNLFGGGAIYVDPVNDNDIANKKYVDGVIQQIGGGVDLSNLVTLDTEQTITGKKLFSKIQSTQAIVEDNDLTSKAYVDKAIADLGGTITLDDYAKLVETNTFTALNTFDVLPQSAATPTDPKDLVPKQYNDDRLTGVENNINTKIGNLTQLTTNAKDNLVNAINEIKAGTGGDTTNMDLKGTKATYQEIEGLADMVMGDVWECSEVGKEGFYIYDGTAWKLLGSGGEAPTPPPEITLNPNPVITFTVAPTEWTDVTDDTDKKLRGNYKVTKNIDKKGVTNAIFISATSTVTNINYGSILGISIKLIATADVVTQVEIYSYSKPASDVTLLVDLLLVIQEAAYGVGIFNIKQDGSFIYTQTEYDSLELGAKTNGLIYVVQG